MCHTNPGLSDFLEFAITVAHLGGRATLPYFLHADLEVDIKADATPVTAADRAAETAIRTSIRSRFPEHAIFGEEFGAEGPEDARFRWVLDPIDGTKSFVAGVPLFTTLIALERDGVPIVGVIHQPVTGETAAGADGKAFYNGQPIHQKPARPLAKAVLLTTDPKEVRLFNDAPGWANLLKRVGLYRSWGDGYGYLKVITGQADIMFDPVLAHWDKAALLPILAAAGVHATTADGSPPLDGDSLFVARQPLHSEALAALNTPG